MSDETKALTIPISDIRQMAEAVAKSGLFGVKTADQAMALMLIAHAEGLHPAIAARDYDIIQGRPAKKAEAMLRSFLALGGKVEWHELTDEKASATFSHPQGGSVAIAWDMARAKKAGLLDKNGSMFTKYPRQMLRARVISEGVRTVHPGATSGMYTPEEVRDFEPQKKVKVEKVDVPKPDPEWKGKSLKELPPEALTWMLENGDDKQKPKAQEEVARRAILESRAQTPEIVEADIVVGTASP